MNQPHTVIIGNGIAGITTARELRKRSSEPITVISDEADYFFARTALMYVFMGHMKHEHTEPYERGFWKKNKISLMRDRVEEVLTDQKRLRSASGRMVDFDRLVIATGSRWNRFDVKGSELKGVQGLYHLDDLRLLDENTHAPFTPSSKQRVRHAVIVGGGLIGIELAEMLLTRNIRVTFLIREAGFWGNVLPPPDSEFVGQHIQSQGIELITGEELGEILPDDAGRARAVVTKTGRTIPCELVGLTGGVSPNVDFLRHTDLDIDRGILVDSMLRTNKSDIYAAGDCAQLREPLPGRSAIEPVWYTGRMMGECLGRTLAGEPTDYSPGPWFNSAKFLNLEYQTYGLVSPNPGPEERRFRWQHETRPLALHFAWDGPSGRFLGLNSFGIRLRHEVLDHWLRQGLPIASVMSGLREANFDPEFSARYESDISHRFRQTFPEINV